MSFSYFNKWLLNHLDIKNRLKSICIWYLIFLMLPTRKHTIEEAAKFSGLDKSQFSRWLKNHSGLAVYNLDELSKKQAKQFYGLIDRSKKGVLPWTIFFLIDSTIHSRSTRHTDNAKRFNHGKGFVIGHQWTNVVLVINDKIIPLAPIAFYTKKYCRKHKLTYQTENDAVVNYIEKLNNHQLKAGGFKLSAESTDTGRKTRLSFFNFYSFIGTWLKMVLKIAFYHFVGNLTRCCTKIPPRPKMPPPISLFKVGKFFQQFRRRPTLYPSHYLTWCQIRRRRDEHMHMILTHNSTYDIDLKCLTSLTNKLFDSKCHFTLQYFITIFCYPYKMILNIENRMTSISIFHKPSYSRVDSNINPVINLSA